MPRRRYRNSEPSPFEALVDALLTLPWWGGVALSLFVFVMLKWIFPWVMTPAEDPAPVQGAPAVPSMKLMVSPLVQVSKGLATPAFALCLVLVGAGRLIAWSRRSIANSDSARELKATPVRTRHDSASNQHSAVDRLLAKQTTLQQVGQLSWSEFEVLLERLFMQLGYTVERTGKNTADGGIDLVLTIGSERTIVQCKHWQARQVPVSVVREQLGLKHSHRAHHCIVVTSGSFTADGISFAGQNGIILIDGSGLEQLIENPVDDVFKRLVARSDSKNSIADAAIPPSCPHCGGRTIRKVATKGRFQGQPFWACVRYPDCKGKIDAS